MSPPSRGAWIEMPGSSAGRSAHSGSPPSRGAWIEIRRVICCLKKKFVAPLAGGVD